MRCYRVVGGGSECSGRSILILFIKENWICAMTRRHAESNINMLLTRNLIDSDIKQWSHSLMIPLHCLWTKSNNRTRGQFECDVTYFCFCFDFIRSQALCGCCSIVGWRGWGEWVGKGGSFKIGRPSSRGWKYFGRRWTRRGCGGVLEN